MLASEILFYLALLFVIRGGVPVFWDEVRLLNASLRDSEDVVACDYISAALIQVRQTNSFSLQLSHLLINNGHIVLIRLVRFIIEKRWGLNEARIV